MFLSFVLDDVNSLTITPSLGCPAPAAGGNATSEHNDRYPAPAYWSGSGSALSWTIPHDGIPPSASGKY